jgi:hypothetical protein
VITLLQVLCPIAMLAFFVYDRVFGKGKKAAEESAKYNELLARQATHEQVCDMRQKHVQESLERIETSAGEDREASREFRHSLAEKLTSMEIKLAVAVQPQGRRK